MISRRDFTKGTAGLLLSAAVAKTAQAEQGAPSGLDFAPEELLAAIDAYVYAYPLVTMEMTRRVFTNVAEPEATRGPMGSVIRLREYPNASFRDVTAPNADTLYTTAFFDLSAEPYVLSLPDMADRYALFPLLDGWTNVFEVPGKRTTGTGPQTYAITGPGWTGSLPEGVVEYKSPTNLVWLLGRIYCTGTPEDYDAVHKLQDACKLVPLSAWGTDYTPPKGTVDPAIDMKTPVRDQVDALSTDAFFTLFCTLLNTNPPAEADAPILARLASIGIEPGKDYDPARFTALLKEEVPKLGKARIMAHLVDSDGDITRQNGWIFTTRTGVYGTSYTQRALITVIGLGANRPQDAVYPTSMKPEGLLHRAYLGSENYVLSFPKGHLPPVNGFWSLTMYDENFFFVENPINRYSISPRQDLKANADGSVDLLIQHASPGADKESNWLPAPAGQFKLMLRMYWPKEANPSIIDGSWTVPEVKKVG